MLATITYIELGSIAQDLGWEPGDEIVSINGHALHDIIDFRYYCADEFLDVVLRHGAQTVEFEIEKDYDEPLGVEFEDALFDGVRLCGAHCIFCFVEQLPKGLRKSLYLKDDDYRLSFLHGNFVTLANVTDEDLERIVAQRLSPLYVSVHTTVPALREKMLGREAPNILDQIDKLSDGRIAIQTQIVLCRGINDGDYLLKTVEDLASRHPTVQSIAIVPVGLSAHRRNTTPIGAIDQEYSAEIIRQVKKWQKAFKAKYGTRLVWAADEFYLSAGRPIPKVESYEGYPQIENGVGLVRQFKESAKRAKAILPKKLPRYLKISVTTGELGASILTEWAKALTCENLEIKIWTIENRLFGKMVTVAGLMAGHDIIDQLKGYDLGEAVFVPSVALRDKVFLDDIKVDQVSKELDRPVIAVPPRPYQLIRAILKLVN